MNFLLVSELVLQSLKAEVFLRLFYSRDKNHKYAAV